MAFWDRLKGVIKSEKHGDETPEAEPTHTIPIEPTVQPSDTLDHEPEVNLPAKTGFLSRFGTGFTQRLPRAKMASLGSLIREKFPKNLDDLKRLQTDGTLERLGQAFSTKASGTSVQLAATAFMAYFLADTVSLLMKPLIPEPPTVPPPRIVRRDETRKTIEEYAAILNRNIFSSKNIIPEDNANLANGPARKSALPLNLVGTVVLADELKSIAAIEDKSQNLVFPVRVDDTISDKVQITKIEHLKVFFINKSSGHLEYIEIVEDFPLLSTQALRPGGGSRKSSTGITQADENRFDIERNAVDKAVGNLSEVLQQARAIPNFENGIPDGYKIIQIVPGSIYDQLGIKNGDVVVSLNGDPLSDPGKAFQVFNDLKNLNHIEIGVKRGGRKMQLQYDIR